MLMRSPAHCKQHARAPLWQPQHTRNSTCSLPGHKVRKQHVEHTCSLGCTVASAAQLALRAANQACPMGLPALGQLMQLSRGQSTGPRTTEWQDCKGISGRMAASPAVKLKARATLAATGVQMAQIVLSTS